MGERVELRNSAGELTGWELITSPGLWEVLHDGWATLEVRLSNTGHYFKSRAREEIPAFVWAALPSAAMTQLPTPDPYDTCSRCGGWHYTHGDEKHTFVASPI